MLLISVHHDVLAFTPCACTDAVSTPLSMHLPLLLLPLQDGLEGSQGVDGNEEGGVQLDASQLAEYRQLKAQADDKTGCLLQDMAALEAQLKVG